MQIHIQFPESTLSIMLDSSYSTPTLLHFNQVVGNLFLGISDTIEFPDETSVLEFLKTTFKVIHAAGGVVQNEEKAILFIHRYNKWDLPKGKVEKKESLEDAAIREVQEECGLKQILLQEFIMSTYHVYMHKNIPTVKVSHWYSMQSSNKEILIPQISEGITDVQWIPIHALAQVYNSTYPTIISILDTYFKREIIY